MSTLLFVDISSLIVTTGEIIKEKEMELRGLQIPSQSAPVRHSYAPFAAPIEHITAEKQARARASHDSFPSLKYMHFRPSSTVQISQAG